MIDMLYFIDVLQFIQKPMFYCLKRTQVTLTRRNVESPARATWIYILYYYAFSII